MYITLKGWRISNNGCLSKDIEDKRFILIMIVLQFSTMHFDFINFLADFSSNIMKIFSILVKSITQFEETDKVHIYIFTTKMSYNSKFMYSKS